MRRATSLLGLPVLGPAGQRLGTVRDLILGPAGDRVAALVLEPAGWLRPGRLVDWTAVTGVADAVFVSAFPRPFSPGESGAGPAWRELAGQPVYSPAGSDLGQLADVWVDPATGSITGYQVSAGLVEDLLLGQSVIPGPAPLVRGRSAVILGADAAGNPPPEAAARE